jgi:polar amino acid transport system substrate-binding protein
MNLHRLLLAIALAACAAHAAWGAGAGSEPGRLKVQVVAEAFPPFQYTDATGEARGAAYRLVMMALDDVAHSMPIEVAPIQFMPLRRALQNAATQPNLIVLSVARTPQRERQFKWLAPLSPYELWLYRYKDRAIAPVKDFSQLRRQGYRFGVQTGSNFHEWLLRQGVGTKGDNSVIDPVPQNGQNFGKARLGRVDLFAHPEISFAYRASEHGLRAADFEKVLLVQDLSTPLWAIASTGSDARLVAALAQQLNKMRQSGQAERIRREAIREFNAMHHIDVK